MNESCKLLIKNALQASVVTKGAVLQPLWSGYGEVFRAHLSDSAVPSVVVKHSNPEHHDGSHPKGWHNDASVRRKLNSYEVEQTWYEQYAKYCNDNCRIPTCYATDAQGQQRWIVLEDLDSSGYPRRLQQLTTQQCKQCLKWLAHFHANFLHTRPTGLWPVGTYWHLATRLQEWQACQVPELKNQARRLDELLSNCANQTLVHGDAKVANFCFSVDDSTLGVAAVDFQYVGGGCGIKDVAYFLGSCLTEQECYEQASYLLDTYFECLKDACRHRPNPILGEGFLNIESEWRTLYPVAWADFHRFLAGWSPEHKKINGYAQLQTEIALDGINE